MKNTIVAAAIFLSGVLTAQLTTLVFAPAQADLNGVTERDFLTSDDFYGAVRVIVQHSCTASGQTEFYNNWANIQLKISCF